MCAFKNNIENKKHCSRQCELCQLKKYATTFNVAVTENTAKESNPAATKGAIADAKISQRF